MRFVTMDDEGRDLLEAGMEMAHAALAARARRVDPEGIISRSVEMSKIKTDTLLHQLRQPPMADWLQLSEDQRALALDLMLNFIEANTDDEKTALWRKFRAVTLVRAEPDNSARTEPGAISGSVQVTEVAGDTAMDAGKRRRLPSLRRRKSE